jgi:intergrase/recombinase
VCASIAQPDFRSLDACLSVNSVEPPLGFEPRTFSLQGFEDWVKSRYVKSYSNLVLCYARKYGSLVNSADLKELDSLPASIKNNVIKTLVILSKFLGNSQEFRSRLKNFDIKTTRPDTLNAFLRILNASNSDVMSWYNTIILSLRDNERTFSKFLLHSGLRVDEAISSFNNIIELSRESIINEYYDQELNCLCHFKYPKQFIRRTKNCFITFITQEFLGEIANSETVTYSSIRKRLERKKIRLRFNELRDYFGTYLLQHGLLEQEVNLLQGRIPVSIFIRHYWSPKLKELGNRVFSISDTF